MPKDNLYPYEPRLPLAILFAALVGLSLCIHIFQNLCVASCHPPYSRALTNSTLSYHRFWRITFFMTWGGLVFTIGWIVRAISTQNPTNLGLYIAETILIYAGPPIYAAAEYNILGRLMHYLPMHASLNPGRLVYLFIYIGVLVEALTGAGAGRIARSELGSQRYKTGGTLIAAALLIQGAVELIFVYMVATLHLRCKRKGMLTPNVRTVCFTLYGTAGLVVLRCLFRAVEAFTQYLSDCEGYYCGGVVNREWYLYVFEAAPMLVYTYWLNLIHPGRFLPREHKRYLDADGRTERMGPGWVDNRPKAMTYIDIFDFEGAIKGRAEDAKFWERPEEWPACQDGTFASGTASNRRRKQVVVNGKGLA